MLNTINAKYNKYHKKYKISNSKQMPNRRFVTWMPLEIDGERTENPEYQGANYYRR